MNAQVRGLFADDPVVVFLKESGASHAIMSVLGRLSPLHELKQRASGGPETAQATRALHSKAFSLIEVLFAVAIVGVLVVVLYAAMANSIPMVRSCQENEQVTQILTEKLDTIRLYNWTQITNTWVPNTFIVGIDPLNTNSTPYYTGTVSIVYAPITEPYKSELLQVTVTVDWVSNERPQSQSMVTYVAKYGLQTYIMQ